MPEKSFRAIRRQLFYVSGSLNTGASAMQDRIWLKFVFDKEGLFLMVRQKDLEEGKQRVEGKKSICIESLPVCSAMMIYRFSTVHLFTENQQ